MLRVGEWGEPCLLGLYQPVAKNKEILMVSSSYHYFCQSEGWFYGALFFKEDHDDSDAGGSISNSWVNDFEWLAKQLKIPENVRQQFHISEMERIFSLLDLGKLMAENRKI